MTRLIIRLLPALVAALQLSVAPAGAYQDFHDRTHYSQAFGQWRHYRILLPPDYETSGKHYPVVYYFHGHSSRYMGEPYGDGLQVSLPEMIDYLKTHDVICVRWDGWVEDNYSNFYSGSPYDIQSDNDPPEGQRDFGAYFLDLVAHIDSNYRTIADRQHRATCGLSMGGFMSLYLSGRYPQLVGSASSYNPGHEFWVGPAGAKSHYMLRDFTANHGATMVRLIRTSGDYISQYHDELHERYSRNPDVDYEFRREEYHRHWVKGLAETLDFHLRAFGSKSLNDTPRSFDHDNAFADFTVWGYHLQVANKKAGYTCLRGVTRNYFRVFTRAWQPDGPAVEGQTITVTTPMLYGNARQYRIMDYNHATGQVSYYTLTSTGKGRLTFKLDGNGHDIAVLDGSEGRAPVLLPVYRSGSPIVKADVQQHVPLRLLNSCDITVRDIGVSLSSRYPTVEITGGEITIDSISPGGVVDLTGRISQRFVSTSGFFQHCRLNLHIRYAGWYGADKRIDVRVLPSPLETPDSVLVLDGRSATLDIFRQAGNQGGGFVRQRTVTEGTGNGNGVAEPGEEVTLWVRTVQGLDPLDKKTWHRVKVYSYDPYVTVTQDIAEQKGLEWTSVKDHTSAIMISPGCPGGREIELFLESESYSYLWKPDYRFGEQLLYQAFQFHRDDVGRYGLKIGD
ncbi:MAG: esterase family protein [Candidatus Glassbacteria bacterium]|nr:esterase family protein [Candidatus Glassbacteria bacterium]